MISSRSANAHAPPSSMLPPPPPSPPPSPPPLPPPLPPPTPPPPPCKKLSMTVQPSRCSSATRAGLTARSTFDQSRVKGRGYAPAAEAGNDPTSSPAAAAGGAVEVVMSRVRRLLRVIFLFCGREREAKSAASRPTIECRPPLARLGAKESEISEAERFSIIPRQDQILKILLGESAREFLGESALALNFASLAKQNLGSRFSFLAILLLLLCSPPTCPIIAITARHPKKEKASPVSLSHAQHRRQWRPSLRTPPSSAARPPSPTCARRPPAMRLARPPLGRSPLHPPLA